MRKLLSVAVALSAILPSSAQGQSVAQAEARAAAGAAFETGRSSGSEKAQIVPGLCVPAWHVAGDIAIRLPEAIAESSPDISERNASAIWRHWWMVHYEETGGPEARVPLPQAEATLRGLQQALNSGNPVFFEILGACWVDAKDRKSGDGRLLLRNYMVQRGDLPASFSVTSNVRAERTRTITTHDFDFGLSAPRVILYPQAANQLLDRCEGLNGIPGSAITRSRRDRVDGFLEWVWSMKCEVF